MSPVRKFRTLEEAERALWTAPPGDLLARIRAVWRRAAVAARRVTPPGVRRYRTLEEAGRDRHRGVEDGAGPRDDRETG